MHLDAHDCALIKKRQVEGDVPYHKRQRNKVMKVKPPPKIKEANVFSFK